MKTRVSIGDIIFLVLTLAGLALLWHFFSPPTWFVLSCLGLGAASPILWRLTRIFLPKSLPLPFMLILAFVLLAYHHFPALPYRSVVFFGTYFTALAVGFCTIEFSLRPFFPLKPLEKDA
jgi:hypothetical protein